MKPGLVPLILVVMQFFSLQVKADLIHPGLVAQIGGISVVDIVLNPNSHLLYATDALHPFDLTTGVVRVFDTSTNTQVAAIPVGGAPQGIAINTVTNRIYAVNVLDQTLSVIDGNTNTVIDTVSGFGFRPRFVEVNPVTNTVYVTTGGNGIGTTLTVIDGATDNIIQRIQVGRGPEALAINVNTNRIYTPNQGDNSVSVIDGATNSVLATVPIGRLPLNAAVDDISNTIYVSNSNDNTVSVINGNTNTVTGTILVGGFPRGIAFDDLGDQIFLANMADDTLSILDRATHQLLFNIPAGSNPVDVVFDPQNDRIYVADRGAGFAGGGGGIAVIGNVIPEPSSLLLVYVGTLSALWCRFGSARRNARTESPKSMKKAAIDPSRSYALPTIASSAPAAPTALRFVPRSSLARARAAQARRQASRTS